MAIRQYYTSQCHLLLQTRLTSLITTNNNITRTIETITNTTNNITPNSIINSTMNIIPMIITHDNERNYINTYAAENNGERSHTMRTTLQTSYPNVRNFNLASKLNVLNIKSMY